VVNCNRGYDIDGRIRGDVVDRRAQRKLADAESTRGCLDHCLIDAAFWATEELSKSRGDGVAINAMVHRYSHVSGDCWK
jgi:hypothetical protein